MGQICGTCCNKDKQIAIEDANSIKIYNFSLFSNKIYIHYY